MSTMQTIRRQAATYTPTTSRQAQIAEALGCIISGRAFPAHLAPPAQATSAPATVAEGLARILRGPAVATPS